MLVGIGWLVYSWPTYYQIISFLNAQQMNQIDPSTYFLSCDWGTSNFRLKLVDKQNGEVIGSIEKSAGVKETFNAWQQFQQVERAHFYKNILGISINELSKKLNTSLAGFKVVLSGMASSTIGLKELPYASLPMSLDSTGLVKETLEPSSTFPHEILLISGLQKPGDVMRGEEIQAIGWGQLSESIPEACLLILPGTHSKHIFIKNHQIVDFKTYLTGELYEIMTTQSILKNSIDRSQAWNDATRVAFIQGVSDIKNGSLTNLFFSIRAKGLQKRLNPGEAAYYLSGLLIGEELKDAIDYPIVLCCPPKFDTLYYCAIEAAGLVSQTTRFSPERVDELVIQGQMVAIREK